MPDDFLKSCASGLIFGVNSFVIYIINHKSYSWERLRDNILHIDLDCFIGCIKASESN